MSRTKTGDKAIPSGLYGIALQRIIALDKYSNQKSKIIRFPKVFEIVCRSFSVKKDEAWSILFVLRDFGFIKIIPFQGIIIL